MKRFKIGLLLATLYAASVFAQENADTEVAAQPEPAPTPIPAPAPVLEPAPVVQQAQVESVTASAFKFHIGARLGLGISAMRGHKPLKVQYINNRAVALGPALSMGGGVAFAIEINNMFTLAPELQYTWYRANGKTTWQNKIGEAGANLHSFELPILARFGFGLLYAEVGPQVGYNYYASTYKNSDWEKPKNKDFAFGPSIGFGTNMGFALLGIRTHFGLLEYAENTKGYPWTVQVSATKFFF